MTAPASKELDPQVIISKLLTELGEPWLPIHHQALAAVKEGDATTLRLLTPSEFEAKGREEQ
ncbi:MAG: hypothetical protein AAFQ63_15650 [Cyanobacteria bacterium J06621_11]